MKVSVIFGTRPEAIKLAPVVLALKKNPHFECHVCVTAQHRQMLDSILKVFGIVPDVDLNLMEPDQTLAALTGVALKRLDCYMKDFKPDMVMVQGDTATTLAGAMAAFFYQIPVIHLEAGLRTGNLMSPWPEEGNRKMVTQIATLHLAPTALNKQNLLRESVDEESIVVTGNTVVDALFFAVEKAKGNLHETECLPSYFMENERRMVLITGHRRENFGKGFLNICKAIACLASKYPDIDFVYPVHLNPNVQKPVLEILGGEAHAIPNIHLIEPQDYLSFIALMQRAFLILTDSGGVQEEAPSLGVPVLVLRDTTERPEAVDAGTVRLVGTDYDAIVEGASALLDDEVLYKTMSICHNPYGDGKAAERVVDALLRNLSKKGEEV